jgi:hypothetical protein
LDGYYAPVDQETKPTSDLPVSGSIPVSTNWLQNWCMLKKNWALPPPHFFDCILAKHSS